MNSVLRKIFSFENFVWMSNQIVLQFKINYSIDLAINSFKEIIKSHESKISNHEDTI